MKIKTTSILSAILTTFLVNATFAGGDDRDRGPTESLDSIAPVNKRVVIDGKDAKNMMLIDEKTKQVVRTPSGSPITLKAHESCKNKLALSASNIARFKNILASGHLYNTGPLNPLGTEFSPARWNEYFNCVETHSS